MNYEQLILQLGVCGAVIWAVVKLGVVFIERWSTAEAARTKVLADGFAAMNGHVVDVKIGIARMDEKIDALDSSKAST